MAFLQPYMDKENSSQLGVLPQVRVFNATGAPVGKTFQSSQLQTGPIQRKGLGDRSTNVQTPAIGDAAMARKALGTINRNVAKNLQPHKEKSADFLKPPEPASKPIKPKAAEKQKSLSKSEPVVSKATKSSQRPSFIDEDIEFMDNQPEEQDRLEDIWPEAQRPESYISQLHEWRPLRLQGYSIYMDRRSEEIVPPDSDSDDERLKDCSVEEPDASLPWETVRDSPLCNVLECKDPDILQ